MVPGNSRAISALYQRYIVEGERCWEGAGEKMRGGYTKMGVGALSLKRYCA